MSPAQAKKKVLVICTHNSVRSQMAEAFFHAGAADRFTVHSAGTEPGSIDPRTVQVMNEVGIDLSGRMAKDVSEFVGQRFDTVITVCESARQACPDFPGLAEKLHWNLSDPKAAAGTPEEQLAQFRTIRDAVKTLVAEFLKTH